MFLVLYVLTHSMLMTKLSKHNYNSHVTHEKTEALKNLKTANIRSPVTGEQAQTTTFLTIPKSYYRLQGLLRVSLCYFS